MWTVRTIGTSWPTGLAHPASDGNRLIGDLCLAPGIRSAILMMGMSDSMEGNDKGRHITSLVALASILVVYVLLLWIIEVAVPAAWRSWAVVIVPNGWIGVTSFFWARHGQSQLVRFTGGRRVWPGLIVAVIAVALVVMMAMMESPLRTFGVQGDIEALLQHVLLVSLVPLVEELYFRGIVLDYMRQRAGSVFALVFVSALFGFLHFPQGTALPMVVLSLITCLLALSAQSMLWAVVVHVGWNAAAVVRVSPYDLDRWVIASVGIALLIGLSLWGITTRDREDEA